VIVHIPRAAAEVRLGGSIEIKKRRDEPLQGRGGALLTSRGEPGLRDDLGREARRVDVRGREEPGGNMERGVPREAELADRRLSPELPAGVDDAQVPPADGTLPWTLLPCMGFNQAEIKYVSGLVRFCEIQSDRNNKCMKRIMIWT
jgi:hypothetical protein